VVISLLAAQHTALVSLFRLRLFASLCIPPPRQSIDGFRRFSEVKCDLKQYHPHEGMEISKN